MTETVTDITYKKKKSVVLHNALLFTSFLRINGMFFLYVLYLFNNMCDKIASILINIFHVTQALNFS